MLGGFEELHAFDIKFNNKILNAIIPNKLRLGDGMDLVGYGTGRKLALDAGAGIGRITEHLLLPAGFEKACTHDLHRRMLSLEL